jgi:hypothetical protein
MNLVTKPTEPDSATVSADPSLLYLWHFPDVPRFGDLHDDSLYYVSAKSLADGGGYRIESLPGEPSQTKYPPLYPLLLSIAWRIDPQFPHNLPVAAWISWLALPAVLLQLAALYPSLGISTGRSWILLFLFAANPYVILFSTQLLSEMLFPARSPQCCWWNARPRDPAERLLLRRSRGPGISGALGRLALLVQPRHLPMAASETAEPRHVVHRRDDLFHRGLDDLGGCIRRDHRILHLLPRLLRYEIYSVCSATCIYWSGRISTVSCGIRRLCDPKDVNSGC